MGKKAEDSRVKMIKIFRCIAAALSRLSKHLGRIRCPAARTDASLLVKMKVKVEVASSEPAPESSHPHNHCVVTAAVARQMNSRQAIAIRNRLMEAVTGILNN